MIKWPQNKYETVDFESLINPFVKLSKQLFTYKLAKNWNKNKYVGYYLDKESGLTASCLPISKEFNEESFEYHKERGRCPMTILLSNVMRIGICQGMRFERKNIRGEILLLKSEIELLRIKLERLSE